jgi:hypothetical protein
MCMCDCVCMRLRSKYVYLCPLPPPSLTHSNALTRPPLGPPPRVPPMPQFICPHWLRTYIRIVRAYLQSKFVRIVRAYMCGLHVRIWLISRAHWILLCVRIGLHCRLYVRIGCTYCSRWCVGLSSRRSSTPMPSSDESSTCSRTSSTL